MAIHPISEELWESQKRGTYPLDAFFTDLFEDFSLDDAHKAMLKAFEGRDVNVISLWTTPVRTGSGRRVGRLDIAIDRKSKEACGSFRLVAGDSDLGSDAIWFECEDAYEAALAVWDSLEEMGLFDNLEEIIERTLAKARPA